ncbi:hypothetical protein AC1031_006927 [Aphanomyces cochlioides]|nr:hypothetical protein AC1031_009363 [Aphanomyces cochlioides]KAG9402301.1 hypothetical protein AC1031_006927 [Aphanomyces cochlioides]
MSSASAPVKYVVWTESLETSLLREITRIEPFAAEHGELLPRWKSVAANLIDQEPKLTYRSARDHFDNMVKEFKKIDHAQRRSSGSEEYVSEKVQLLQDLIMRMDEAAATKKRKQGKENERKEELETTGEKLCRDAEVRVAKRAKQSTSSPAKDNGDSSWNDLLEFEKKRHNDDHEYRMERLKFDKEEQQLRRAQSAQLESIVATMARFITEQSKK